MNSKLLIFIAFVIAFLASCQKEDEVPCINFPCNGTDNELINYNRVAYDPTFRIGTWVDVRASATSPGTIIFHNDSIWSLFNELGGYFEGKYEFNGLYLQILTDVNNQALERPIKYQTIYDDSTGIFSILLQHGANGFQQWNHYIKVE